MGSRKILAFILGVTMSFSISTTSVFASDKGNEVIPKVNIVQIQNNKANMKVSDVIDKVNQSVVAVIGKNSKAKDIEEIYTKFPKNLQHGSGVIVNKEGRILTNNHVVEGLDEIFVVTYDGNVYKAKLLCADKELDLALLKINRTDLKPIELVSESEIKVGEEVIAIGTPLSFGYRNSATKGIISGLNRPVDRAYNYLQTDAAINPGNSGGPLVNMKGELVGINTLGNMVFQGMNFSIPIGNINYFLDHYNKFGGIKRCFTGIEFEENWAALLGLPSKQGLKVVAIQKDSVVTSDKVKEGDMLEAIDGKNITSIAQYNESLKKYLPGDKVKLTFVRNNQKFDITVVLKEMPKQEK